MRVDSPSRSNYSRHEPSATVRNADFVTFQPRFQPPFRSPPTITKPSPNPTPPPQLGEGSDAVARNERKAVRGRGPAASQTRPAVPPYLRTSVPPYLRTFVPPYPASAARASLRAAARALHWSMTTATMIAQPTTIHS
jgi:hypothetical protein